MSVTSIRLSSLMRNIFHLSFESSDTSGFSLLNTTTVLGVLNFNSLLSNLAATVLPFFIFSSNSKGRKISLPYENRDGFLEQKFWLSRLLPWTVLLDLDTRADDVTISGRGAPESINRCRLYSFLTLELALTPKSCDLPY